MAGIPPVALADILVNHQRSEEYDPTLHHRYITSEFKYILKSILAVVAKLFKLKLNDFFFQCPSNQIEFGINYIYFIIENK